MVSGNHYTVLLSAAIMEELGLSSRQQYGVMVTRYRSYSCFVLLKMGDSETRNRESRTWTKINSVTCASCWDLYTKIYVCLQCGTCVGSP